MEKSKSPLKSSIPPWRTPGDLKGHLVARNCQNYTLKQLTNEIERYNRAKVKVTPKSSMYRAYEEGIKELGREISRRIKLVEFDKEPRESRKPETQVSSF